MPPSILILAGESSGDRAGGRLAEELRRQCPEARLLGMGGPQLRAAGVEILQDSEELGAMGFWEVLREVPRLRRLERRLEEVLDKDPPSVVVPIDYPGFNLRIARKAHARGIPVVYYIGPQVWAWGAGRIPRIAESVDRMLVVFPFEVDLYREAGVRTDCPGHPLLDTLADAPPREQLRRELQIEDDVPLVGLLPGSRLQEVERILPVMAESVRLLGQDLPALRAVVSVASSIPREEVARHLRSEHPTPITLHEGPAASLITAADFLLVTSGTATLESALLGTPLAVLYRTSPLTWFLGKRLVRIPRISLVNIVAEEDLVPEFLQDEAQPAAIAEHMRSLLADPAAREQLAVKLGALRTKLGSPGGAARAAAMVLEEMR